MKRFFPHITFGLALWLIALGGTSCISVEEEDILDHVQGVTVKTQMAMSVPQGGRMGRMTAYNVQKNGDYRGMSDAWLVSLVKKDDQSLTINGGLNQLGAIASFDEAEANVKVYKDVRIDGGTNEMLFYGMATPTTPSKPFEEGALSSNLTQQMASLDEIQFKLQPCMDAQNEYYAAFEADKATLLAGLNGMLMAAQAWKAPKATPLQQSFFQKMTSMQAGSGAMIHLLMQDLYLTLKESKAILGEDAAATVDAILQAIAQPTQNGTAVLFKYNQSNNALVWHNPKLAKFPEAYSLPEGGMQLEYQSSSNTYRYNPNSWIGEEGTSGAPGNGINLKNICYPAALAYYVQSPLRLSSQGDVKNWSALWKTPWPQGWDLGAVSSSTRAVALESPIQYGVTLLKSTFQCVYTELEHRANYKVKVGTGFPVKAILVGCQPETTGWNFEPKAHTKLDRVVYDRHLLGEANPLKAAYNVASPENYTLVMPNAHDTDKEVHVAVEFLNSSSDNIYGVDGGIIPPGGTFYLVGTLKMTPEQISDERSVFEPDHFTLVNFKIKSLKNAYVTIPDLRSVRLAVGMYVDIEWGRYKYGNANLGE